MHDDTAIACVEHLLDLLIRWSFGVAVGAGAVFGFVGHTFEARQVAEQIGFPPGNPFQWEVAWANLGLGVVALIALLWMLASGRRRGAQKYAGLRILR